VNERLKKKFYLNRYKKKAMSSNQNYITLANFFNGGYQVHDHLWELFEYRNIPESLPTDMQLIEFHGNEMGFIVATQKPIIQDTACQDICNELKRYTGQRSKRKCKDSQ
jgi:hypothetical protein